MFAQVAGGLACQGRQCTLSCGKVPEHQALNDAARTSSEGNKESGWNTVPRPRQQAIRHISVPDQPAGMLDALRGLHDQLRTHTRSSDGVQNTTLRHTTRSGNGRPNWCIVAAHTYAHTDICTHTRTHTHTRARPHVYM